MNENCLFKNKEPVRKILREVDEFIACFKYLNTEVKTMQLFPEQYQVLASNLTDKNAGKLVYNGVELIT